MLVYKGKNLEIAIFFYIELIFLSHVIFILRLLGGTLSYQVTSVTYHTFQFLENCVNKVIKSKSFKCTE